MGVLHEERLCSTIYSVGEDDDEDDVDDEEGSSGDEDEEGVEGEGMLTGCILNFACSVIKKVQMPQQ